ncbi:MAG: delta-60 repeat domain-containing protein, partial [Verrucomicrobiota bacterium]
MALQADGKVMIGDTFLAVDGVKHHNIARLNVDGSVDVSFNASTKNTKYSDYGGVSSVAVQPDGKILIGGSFNSVNGTLRNGIARLNADGTLESSDPFNSGSGVSQSISSLTFDVFKIEIEPEGKIVIQGTFNRVSDMPCNGFARLNADGSLESTERFHAVIDPNTSIYGNVLQEDGSMLVWGNFTTLNGTTVNGIARLKEDGSLDTTFNVGEGVRDLSGHLSGYFTQSPYKIQVQPDGKLLIWGSFATVNGVARHGFARLNADGSLESTDTFRDFLTRDSSLSSLILQTDGKILIAGRLITTNGLLYFARLNADGSLESTDIFDPGAGPSAYVHSIALQTDGKILLLGGFSWMNRVLCDSGIVRLNNDPVIQKLAVLNTAQVLWSRGGAAPEVLRVTFESSADEGKTWARLGSGKRVGTSANWQLTGLSLPPNGIIRVLGLAAQGSVNRSYGLIEQTVTYSASDLAPIAPKVTTSPATALTATGATLNAVVSSNIAASNVAFQYSTDATFSSGITTTSPAQTLASDASETAVNKAITGLTPHTVYYFRAIAANSEGSTNGAILRFTPGNTAPIAPDGIIKSTTGEQQTVTIPFPALDADGNEVGIIGAASGTNATVDSFTSTTVTFTSASTAETGSFTYTVGDGNGATATGTITLLCTDNDPPDTTISSSFTSSTSASIVLTATDNVAVAGFEGRLDAAPFASVTNPVVLTGLGEGAHTYEIRARDTAGNMDATPAAVSWTVDTLTPVEPGTLDTTYNPNITGGSYLTMAVQPDGRTITAGSYTLVDGKPHKKIERLNADGSVDPSFTASANAEITSMAVQADGKILIAGSFNTVNGAYRNGIARLNTDGSLEDTAVFDPATDTSGLFARTVQPDGKILFAETTGIDQYRIIYIRRTNANGSVDTTFNTVTV